jgi:hypothetical protein
MQLQMNLSKHSSGAGMGYSERLSSTHGAGIEERPILNNYGTITQMTNNGERADLEESMDPREQEMRQEEDLNARE